MPPRWPALRRCLVSWPLEGREIEDDAIAACAAAASSSVDPADDIHASGDYRKTLIGVMVERALREAIAAPIV